jgi:cytochrome c biogenesis protein CcmG/thiol:disulfide interchange protein DsbE
MKRSLIRSPYFWSIVGVATLVLVAWVGRERYRPVITGAVAPDFAAVTLDGSPARLSDYRGKVVLLNVWATWCAPCREEMPSMQRLYEAFADEQDFEVIAVSVDAPMGERDGSGNLGGDLAAFAEQYGLTFTILHNPTGQVQRTYQTTGVPESFVIGRDGLIYRKVAGPTQWDLPVNQQLVRRLLDAHPSSGS